MPVARSHLQLLAGGLGVLLESRLVQDATMLSTLAPSSFAGICLTLLPWLLSGGKLLLHHPFDPPVLVGQWRGDDRCGALVMPGPVAFRLAEAGVFSRTGPACVLAPWRSPERLGTSPDWRERDTVLVDVSVFGEIAAVAARRGASRPAGANSVRRHRCAARQPGRRRGRRSDGNGARHRGAARTDGAASQLSARRRARRPAASRHRPRRRDRHGYTCRLDPGARTLAITGRRRVSSMSAVTASRCTFCRTHSDHLDSGATLAPLPDPLLGQRLIGDAADRYAVRAALNAAGVNPIVTAAFVDRSEGQAQPRLHSAAGR